MVDVVLCRDTCGPLCFKLGMLLDTTKLLFDSSLDGLDVHSKSHGYEKSEVCEVIPLSSCMKQLKCS